MASTPTGGPILWFLLVPGLPQWLRGQPVRGAILAGWFGSAMVAGLASSGTAIGLILLGFAVLVQVGSAADAVELAAFPRLAVGPWARWTSAGLAVVLGCHLPLIVLGSWAGWPTARLGGRARVALIQRGAYRSSSPTAGDRVWIDAHDGVEPGPATVIAGPGEYVRRIDRTYVRPGREPWLAPSTENRPSIELEFRVPHGHLLVAFDPDPSAVGRSQSGPQLVETARVAGRVAAELPEWLRQGPTHNPPPDQADPPQVPA